MSASEHVSPMQPPLTPRSMSTSEGRASVDSPPMIASGVAVETASVFHESGTNRENYRLISFFISIFDD